MDVRDDLMIYYMLQGYLKCAAWDDYFVNWKNS